MENTMVQLNFNAHEVEPSTEFAPLPEGKYAAMITASELKHNSTSPGDHLKLEFVVVDGQHKGRKVWARLNINNESVVAQEIARGQLSAICRAVGVMTPRDSSELHNLPLSIYVKCVPRNDNDSLTNDIKRFEPLGGGAAKSAPVPASAPAPVAAAAAANTAPAWSS